MTAGTGDELQLHLEGAMPALVSPVDDRGRADLAAFQRLVAAAVADGASGVVVGGSTGEGPLLPRGEAVRLVQAAVASSGATPVIAGAYGLTADDVRADVERFAAAGAAAALVLPPFYFPLSADEQVAFFTQLATRAPIPIVAYHIPQLSKSELTREAVVALSKCDMIIGLKDSSGDLNRLRAWLRATLASDFAIFQGDETHLAEALAAGASGSITAIANLHMREVVALHDAVEMGSSEGALPIQAFLSSVSEQVAARAPILAAAVKDKLAADGVLPSRRCWPPIHDHDRP